MPLLSAEVLRMRWVFLAVYNRTADHLAVVVANIVHIQEFVRRSAMRHNAGISSSHRNVTSQEEETGNTQRLSSFDNSSR